MAERSRFVLLTLSRQFWSPRPLAPVSGSNPQVTVPFQWTSMRRDLVALVAKLDTKQSSCAGMNTLR